MTIALTALLLAPAGCSQKRRWHKHPAFATQRDAAKYLSIALADEHPDERRKAVNRIARTRHLKQEVVLDALDVIARTDPSPAVRCAALAALRKSGQPRAVTTYVAILDSASSVDAVRPPPAQVRREALRGALALLDRGQVAPHRGSALREVAARSIAQDRSRDIRQASARMLGYFQDRSVLQPLIDALEQRDFGVVYEAERSLMRLTGQTFQHDPVLWRQWLAQTDNPFADAGELDHRLEPNQKGWWRRSMESIGRGFNSFRPKKKDS